MEFKVSPSEEPAIRATVQAYIDGFLGSDTALLRQAFDSDAKLIAASEGKIAGTATAAWFDRIDQRKEAGTTMPKATSKVAGIDQHGDAAVVRVELVFPEYQFTDYLALLKTSEGWKIANKIYTTA